MKIPLELIEQFARGNGVIFVGAGLSQGAGLPSSADIVRELATELEDCPTDVDHREIAQYYEIEKGRQRLVQKLRDQLNRLGVRPTAIHEILPKLPVSTIFTTNYDNLLEQALGSAKRRFTPVVSNVDASFWSADQLQLVKLHGDLNQPKSIVITTEDYQRFASDRVSLARLLAATLQTCTVLFLGYGATDPDLDLILTQVHDEVRDKAHNYARTLYTVQFGLNPLKAKRMESRGLKVVDLGSQPDNVSQNAALLTWLQRFHEQVAAEKQKLQPKPSLKPQTAAQVLASEIQVWLNAMGYTVTSQPSPARHLDLEAKLQRGLEEQHILVRCIAGEITVRHLETLSQEISKRNVAKGWAVSDRRIPPSARDYANTIPSIRPFSLADFVSQIFGPYFEGLRQLVTESNIPRYYVDLACYRRVVNKAGKEITRDHYQVIDEYVDDWLKARDANHISILGEFGAGKTWFCRHYAYLQLERYLKDPVHERLPILITLRDYVKQVEVGSLIRKLLDEQGVRLGGGLEAFEELNLRGKLLLIFDGFDEMAVKVDYQTVVDYFWELAKVVVPNSKALLTCRTSYFRYANEAEKVMRGEELGRKMIVIEPPQFEVVYLKPFTDEQIREVVTRRRGDDVAKTILNNPDLRGLARQPILIEILMEALPDIQSNIVLNNSEIYRLAIERWLERDIRTGRTFMDKWDKLFFMMGLAWEMFSTNKLKLHYKTLPERINQYFNLTWQHDKDHYDYDIRTKSFLQRDAIGYYEFSHKSLMEYFVALKFAFELGATDSKYIEGIPSEKLPKPLPISKLKATFGSITLRSIKEVRNFLVGMISDTRSLLSVINETKGKSIDDVGYVGGNAITIITEKKESLVGMNLAHTVLSGADFSNTTLTGSDLRSAVLNEAIFDEADLTNANLAGIEQINKASFSNIKGISSWNPTTLTSELIRQVGKGNELCQKCIGALYKTGNESSQDTDSWGGRHRVVFESDNHSSLRWLPLIRSETHSFGDHHFFEETCHEYKCYRCDWKGVVRETVESLMGFPY